jgi:hypothetical protein
MNQQYLIKQRNGTFILVTGKSISFFICKTEAIEAKAGIFMLDLQNGSHLHFCYITSK